MLPSELKLTNLRHCYVHLPETFVSRKPAIKGGAVVSIKSLQNDHEIHVMWNGQLTAGEHVELDFDFAKANKLDNELVIINSIDNLELSDCTLCHAELVNSSDYTILSQHNDLNLLDTCKLVNRGLIVPIFVSQFVKVLVKVLSFEPAQPFGLLTKWTEMSFQHNEEDEKVKSRSSDETEAAPGPCPEVREPIQFLSQALGLGYEPQFNLGSILITGDKGSGKTYFMKQILDRYKRFHGEFMNCKQLRGKRPESVKKIFTELMELAVGKQPAIIALDDIDSFLESDLKQEEGPGQDVLYKRRLVDTFCHLIKQVERQDKAHLVIIASCRSLDSLDKRISAPKGRSYFNDIIKIGAPDLDARVRILKNLMEDHPQIRSSLDEAQYVEFAQQCNSFMPSDLRRLFERALISACSRSSLDFNSDPVCLEMDNFYDSLEGYVPMHLRSVPLQTKTARDFSCVGGMSGIKESLVKSILMPIKYPKLYQRCPLKPQNSILLYGPPGCGKTLVAEAIANQEGLNSICVRGPELLSKYIGASEAAVRDLFKRAHLARPCIIFFDEFESLAAKRGTDSTGVTDRVVNQFLTILDGVERMSHDVFIIAATSRPDMIDPAMLRPGRMDKHIYCPPPSQQDRLDILQVLSKDMQLDKTVDLDYWAEKLAGRTGADLQAFLFSAQIKSLHEMIGDAQNRPTDSLEITISSSHLERAYSEMGAPDERLLEKYPAVIGQVPKQRVAMRATLA